MAEDTYWPVEGKLKCEWLDCYAGLGVAGRGFCFAGGAWWMQCCPEYQQDDEFLGQSEEECATK
uniref:Uncharacterized protein n=1 Tax=viral metagenome TaxID=1070528 RepID=A0A6H1Z9Z3_9ZZZZ